MKPLSVSQITKFDPTQVAGCERRWWYNKVQGVPEPQTTNQAEGTAIHAELENYLRSGVDSLGPVARAGLHLLPQPGEDLLVEYPFDGVDVGGTPLTGRIDLMHYRGEYVDALGELRREDAPEVLDFKTTSDLKYARPGSALVDLPQMIGYAHVARLRWPDATMFRLSHIYFQKRGKREALKSSVLISLATVSQRWQGILALAARMRDAAKATRPEDVAPNFDSCTAFGGCSFRSICPKSQAQTLTELFKGKGDAMSLLDRLRQSTTPQPTPRAIPVTAPLVTPDAMRAKLLAEEASIKAGVVHTCPTCGDTFLQEAFFKAHRCAFAQPNVYLAGDPIPPRETRPLAARSKDDAPGRAPYATQASVAIFRDSSAATLEERRAIEAFAPLPKCGGCDANLTPLNTSTRNGVTRHIGCTASPITPPDAPVPTKTFEPLPPDAVVPMVVREAAAKLAEPAPEPIPAKRGRKSKVEEKPVSVAIPNNAVEVGDFSQSYTGGLRLFVDCVVEGESVSSLETYINVLLRNLEISFKVTDIRAASGESPLGFGRWKGILAALVRAEPPPEGAFFIRDVRESEVKAVVVEALKPSCRVFVRGL